MRCYDYAFDVETILMLNKKNIKITELPVSWEHRSGSKVSLIKDSIKFFLDLMGYRLFRKKFLQKIY